ncbi:MAG: tRNA (adenosine(37)-N6)-threonylcarbamoyltransferase complex ATPase subunit type 1 TsaE, partial [Pyrinomonadaceae bacterium]
ADRFARRVMREITANTPDDTFAVGEKLGAALAGGEVILLYGGLGAGKTLLTKGILNQLGFDIDEVTSPSFALVNLYKTRLFDVYHIDLWRLDGALDAAEAVGLSEILEVEKAVTIIEWADRIKTFALPAGAISVFINGDGDEERSIRIEGLRS